MTGHAANMVTAVWREIRRCARDKTFLVGRLDYAFSSPRKIKPLHPNSRITYRQRLLVTKLIQTSPAPHQRRTHTHTHTHVSNIIVSVCGSAQIICEAPVDVDAAVMVSTLMLRDTRRGTLVLLKMCVSLRASLAD